MEAIVSIFGILSLIVPPCALIWAFFDLEQKPTLVKAILKIALGVVFAVPLAMLEKRVMAIVIVMVCILVALFDTADMAACRKESRD